MQWVLWMIAVAVLGLAAVAASGRLGELPGTVTDTPRPHVPRGVLNGDDLRGLRFAVVPRGYSMDQVDELLDRLARQLDSAARTGRSEPLPAEADHPEVDDAAVHDAEVDDAELDGSQVATTTESDADESDASLAPAEPESAAAESQQAPSGSQPVASKAVTAESQPGSTDASDVRPGRLE